MKVVAPPASAVLLLVWAFVPTVGRADDDPGDLAKKARSVLETNCYRCHGKDGADEGGMNFILDRARLVARKKVAPGAAAKSKLFARVAAEEMPPADETPRPSKDDVEALRRWIDAGAPDFAPAVAERTFIGPDDVLKAIQDDLGKLGERDRRFARYFTLTHLYNAGLSEDELQSYRNGLSKLVNSLSWDRTIHKPEPIDAARTIFRIDLRDYQWNEKTWQAILARNPYGLTYDNAAAKAVYDATDCPLPYVRGDWFVFAASRPPLYHDVLAMPETAHDLENLLHVDVAEDIRQEKRVARAGFNGSGVSDNNRVVERHETGYGAYWRSFDFADSTGVKNVFDHPLDFQPDGGEIIFNLPNGLQAYMLVNKDGKRIDKGPTNIVHDDKQRDRAVTNGVSCMSCHAQGMISKTDQLRKAVENAGGFTKPELDLVAALYPPETVFTGLLNEDAARFQKALEESGDHVQKADTVVLLAARFDEELDLKLAAAEAGMKPDDFLAGLKRSPKLGRVLGPLTTEGGTVKRDVFVQVFGDLTQELGLGTFVPPAGEAIVNSLGMKLVRINPGTFLMGSPPDEPGRSDDEGPQHEVEITRPFYMGVFTVTRGQFAAFVQDAHYQTDAEKAGEEFTWRNVPFKSYTQTDNDPVVEVTWIDALRFCAWLSRKEGRTYALPTEAEWEYACRAGTKTAYYFGDDPKQLGDFAWYKDNSGGHTHPVGEKKPNPWGLYDMHGNVLQWCADAPLTYQKEYIKDPKSTFNDIKSHRGWYYDCEPSFCRSAKRGDGLPTEASMEVGFRVVLRPAARTP